MTPLTLAYTAPSKPMSDWRVLSTQVTGFAGLLLSGAIFGFFYAWICSTMWGLDATDPRAAIQAMQAMNASVRNAVFAPAFFGTPVVLWIAAVLAWRTGNLAAMTPFGLAGLIYAVGGMILTMTVNVPMNEALAELAIPSDIAAAHEIWTAYSAKWQVYNVIRTVFSAASLLLAGIGVMRSLTVTLPRAPEPPRGPRPSRYRPTTSGQSRFPAHHGPEARRLTWSAHPQPAFRPASDARQAPPPVANA